MKCYWPEKTCLSLKPNSNVHSFVHEPFYLCCSGEVKLGSAAPVPLYPGHAGDPGVRAPIQQPQSAHQLRNSWTDPDINETCG